VERHLHELESRRLRRNNNTTTSSEKAVETRHSHLQQVGIQMKKCNSFWTLIGRVWRTDDVIKDCL